MPAPLATASIELPARPLCSSCLAQAHRAVLPQLPCRVVATVPQDELAAVPWACQEDPRRTAKFMSYAMTAAAEASAVGLPLVLQGRTPCLAQQDGVLRRVLAA